MKERKNCSQEREQGKLYKVKCRAVVFFITIHRSCLTSHHFLSRSFPVLIIPKLSSTMSSTTREYNIVVLGASGYTASIGAKYIAKNCRTDLKWAIAGRSRGKLEVLAEKLKAINPDRIQPRTPDHPRTKNASYAKFSLLRHHCCDDGTAKSQ